MWKHVGQRKATTTIPSATIVREHYLLKTKKHVFNEHLYVSRGRDFMVQRGVTSIVIERKKKLIKFAFIFLLFSQDGSMTKYEQMQTLLVFVKVLNHPSKHWNDYVNWVIIESLHRVVLIAIEEANMVSNFSSFLQIN